MNLYYLKLAQIFLYEKVDQAPITFDVVSITTSLFGLFSKPPPQLGQVFFKIEWTQFLQKVHS